MSVATPISVCEYLRTSYSPDREYVDGAVLERNWGDGPHALMHGHLTATLANYEDPGGFTALISLTIRISETKYRVADVCLLRKSEPYESIPKVAPLLCIEILSPEDGMSAMMEKVDDYLRMGVAKVWLIDPRRRKAYEADTSGYRSVEQLQVPETEIRLAISEAFAELDEVGW